MMVINKRQVKELNESISEKFNYKVSELLIENFSDHIQDNISSEIEMKLFIKRSIEKAHSYSITKENSIIAYIVLSLLNGENFLQTNDFKIYEHYIIKKFYDPNKYIFEIPHKMIAS